MIFVVPSFIFLRAVSILISPLITDPVRFPIRGEIVNASGIAGTNGTAVRNDVKKAPKVGCVAENGLRGGGGGGRGVGLTEAVAAGRFNFVPELHHFMSSQAASLFFDHVGMN